MKKIKVKEEENIEKENIKIRGIMIIPIIKNTI